MNVEIHRMTDGADALVGTIRLVDGELVHDLPQQTERFLRRFAVRVNGNTLTYADGEPWLRALPGQLRGTYLWAEAHEDKGSRPFDEKLYREFEHPRAPDGHWIRATGAGAGTELFQDPYHIAPEHQASPRFKPLGKPTGSTPEAIREAAREKLGQAPVLLTPQIKAKIDGLKPGKEVRLPEGTLVQCNASGTGRHFRIDGPDGAFWRVPPAEVARLAEFEETTARANRFGETIPGNPMVPLPGVDVAPKDPIGDQVGGVLHGGYATLPRGTIVHREAGEGGDTFEITSATGVRRRFPATQKDAIIASARDFERQAEGKLGGPQEDQAGFEPSTRVADPDGPLQPLSPKFRDTRVALHAESERVLGYAHAGNEIALVRTEGGFGTPVYEDRDGKQTQMRVEGTDTVLSKRGEADLKDAIPHVDAEAAQQLADFYEIADRVQRQVRAQNESPEDSTDQRFGAPIIWPEHFDMAVELGHGDSKDPGTRAVYGASPGDEGHPEPYFYINPWELKKPGKDWNATGFNGAILTYKEVLASPDQEKTIRDFYLKYAKLLGAEQRKPGPLERGKER